VRAAVVRSLGEPPVVDEHPDPVGADGRTLVRVAAAPVVPLDLLCSSGTSYFGPPATPYVPGVQGVGRVLESTSLAAGTRVWFATSAGMAPGDGSLAPLCAVDDGSLVPLDTPVADTLVAALGLSGVAAWAALTVRADLHPGERVVVLGGGGAVGQAAAGLARALGAGQVVSVCRTPASRERALAAGAHVAVPLSEDPAALATMLVDACGGPVDVVVDPVFGAAATGAAEALGTGGRLVNLGGSAGDRATFSSAVLRSRQVSILGHTNNALTPAQRAEGLTAVLGHAAAGEVTVAHESRPLEDVTSVWRDQAEGRSAPRSVLLC
jgi:NADPH:quinone reductase-like Zn-dependent oxidoreductase